MKRAWHSKLCRSETLERNSDSSDDDFDSALSIELRQKNDPQYLAKAAKRLDVVWSVSAKKVQFCNENGYHTVIIFSCVNISYVQKNKPDECACCGGTGRGHCYFCRGRPLTSIYSTGTEIQQQ